jgi:hypothetical protein
MVQNRTISSNKSQQGEGKKNRAFDELKRGENRGNRDFTSAGGCGGVRGGGTWASGD